MRGESLRATKCQEVFAKITQVDSLEGEKLGSILRCVFLVACLESFFLPSDLDLGCEREGGCAPCTPGYQRGTLRA